DWDGGAVDVDTGGRPVGPLYPLITGYHEDFQPVWSPRGRWVAYHSHRAKTPVPSYLAPGSSDDIWLRRVGAPARDPSEIRLTDFGWEAGPPDWSRDGTRLLFVSWERGGAAGVSYPYVVTIDTATGRAVGHVVSGKRRRCARGGSRRGATRALDRGEQRGQRAQGDRVPHGNLRRSELDARREGARVRRSHRGPDAALRDPGRRRYAAAGNARLRKPAAPAGVAERDPHCCHAPRASEGDLV